MKQESVVGVDVSARTLSVHGRRGEKVAQEAVFSNDRDGHQKLLKWSTHRGRRARICVEATGVYHLEFALACHRHARVSVMVVNPRATRHFAEARMERAKTDRVDARTILEYLERMPFVAWSPPPVECLELRAISRRISALTDERKREQTRLHASDQVPSIGSVIDNDIEVNIRHLERRIESLREAALKIIGSVDTLQARYEQLVSVTGIAEVSAIRILAEVVVLPEDMRSNQWVAYAGLDPVAQESVDQVKRRRISKRGNKYLRSALYMPALVAIRWSPNIKAFYEKLVSRGKQKLQAIVAVMRKLLVAIWGMFKSNSTFDGEKFYRIAA